MTAARRRHAYGTSFKLMEWFSTHIGKTVTMDRLVAITGASKGTISTNITILTNAGWVITKPEHSKFVCHRVGSSEPDTGLTVRRDEFKRVVRSGLSLTPVVAIPNETVTTIVPQVVDNDRVLQPGDLMEVVFISRVGTIHVEDEHGNHYTVTPL